MQRWFWPLGATIADDGTLRVSLAELRERGDRYLAHSEPVATWMATIDATTLAPLNFAPAPDNSPNLYGWSVVSDLDHTYLFGHCYRQFGFGFLGHDPCTAEIRVARVRRGHLDDVPQYWNGTSWVTDAASTVNIAPRVGPDGERRAVNPMQFGYLNGHWLAATKEGDWWGDAIYLDSAPRPTGPWTTTARLPATLLGPPDTYNTYFASLHPGHPGTVTIGLSNNRWDGHPSSGYRPTFRTVPLRMWNPHTADPQPAPPTPINAPGAPAVPTRWRIRLVVPTRTGARSAALATRDPISASWPPTAGVRNRHRARSGNVGPTPRRDTGGAHRAVPVDSSLRRYGRCGTRRTRVFELAVHPVLISARS
jgi:hypothetical protein